MESSRRLKYKVKAANMMGERMCLIKLQNVEDKQNLMKNRHKLRYIKGYTIYINDNARKKERESGRQIRKLKTKEKELKTGCNKAIVEINVYKLAS